MHASVSVCILLAIYASSITAAQFEIKVRARQPAEAAIVSVEVPASFPSHGTLKTLNTSLPFQRTGPNRAEFVVQGLQAGESRVFTVEESSPPITATAQTKGEKVTFLVGGKRVLTYQGAETALPRPDIKPIFKRGGYIHPVLSPTGKMLTDDYPSNHLHHHGIWFPWTKTVFEGREPDFWNMGEGKGKVEFVKLGPTWSGPVSAGFSAEHRFIDLTGGERKVALNETWEVKTYAVPGADYFVFDLVSVQNCASSSPLKFPKYYYGGLGFRGNWDWNGENNCFFLTSSGETNRVRGNETRANWCHVGGQVDGALTGIAILSHPDNFRSPQPMRLHPKEPFCCFAPSQLGDWQIEPGKPYVSRYRFIVKDGAPSNAELENLWRAYAEPPEVTVSSR